MEITKIEVRPNNERRAIKTRVYIFIENESILENLKERRNRPVKEYKALLPKIFQQIKEQTGYLPEKASWSQKCGCSCGCSPGFIVEGSYGKDVFVTI